MYKLIIEDDEGKTTVVPLIRDEITIGRKEGNTIRLTERNVSRKHARLLKQNGSIFIEDVSSYNGIKLNGDKIDGRATVGEGDRIQIGDYQLALKMDRPQATPGAGNGHAVDGRAATPGAVQAVGAPSPQDEKTLPYMKESGVPTQMIEAPTVQTPMVPMKPETNGLARLVVVSSNFAGQEFLLDKAAVVIGRTDENDVVVNHRSISRHHAKVVRENGHYHVVDLQSANGVRVNGEEYGKVELRRGDHIDLGHVRLRFVAPGEDFVFERDAQVVDVTGTRSGMRNGFVAGIVVLALAGGAAVAWKLVGQPSQSSSQTQNGTKTTNPVDNEGAVAKLLLDSDRAMKSEEWELAIQKCDEALRLDPTQELARDKRQHADAERKNRAAYQRFQQGAEKNDPDGAVAAYGEITEDSIYRQRGGEAYSRVKKSFIRLHLDEARKQKAANECDSARQHVEAVLTVDESNQEALDLVKTCGATAVAKAEPKPRPERVPKPVLPKPERPERPERQDRQDRPVRVAPETKPEASKPAESTESDTPPVAGGQQLADKALQEAQEAYVHGQYATAIDSAKRALKAQPGRAWRIIGASYCFMKDRAGALTAFNKLDSQNKQFLKWVCGTRNGITLP